MSGSEPIIKMEGLTFVYPSQVKALKDINLEVQKGEFLVVMGPNGAGKTTLGLCLNGVIPSVITGDYFGKTIVCGQVVHEHYVYEMGQKVGIALQNPEAQLFSADVQSEIVFGPENLGVPREELQERLDYALEVTRLEGTEKRSTLQLSGGQKQRLALAAAIAMRPEVLVLDEPTSQLDPIGSTEVFSVVRDLNKKLGITIVMMEHKSEEIAEFADRVALLDHGEILSIGDPHDVFQEMETLKRIEVKAPQVSELAYKLKSTTKFPIRLNEAVDVYTKYLTNRKIGELSRKPSQMGSRAKSGDIVLETKDLGYTYETGNVEALKNINIQIRKGEFVAVIGQNGAGKTTLVKQFVGLLKPTVGEMLVFGESTVGMTPGELSKRIGLVLQNPDHQLFSMSVAEEIGFGPKNLKVEAEEIEKRIDAGLKLVGLEEFRDIYPFQLSFGNRRKLSVAAVISMNPEILLLDEPTTAQDYKGRHDIVKIAQGLNRQGETIIMVTHDMELVAEYAERTIVLGKGEVLMDGPTAEVFCERDKLAETFLKPPQITQFAQSLDQFGVPPSIIHVDDMVKLLNTGGAN